MQSVVSAGNNENSRKTNKMSDSVDYFFQTLKNLVGSGGSMSSRASSLVEHEQNN